MSLARINGPTAAPTLVTNVLAACAMGGVSAVDRQVGALIAAALLAALGDHLLRHTRLAAAVTSFACALALLALAGGLVALAGGLAVVALLAVAARCHPHPASVLAVAAARGAIYVTACLAVSGGLALVPLAVAAVMLSVYVAGASVIARHERDLWSLRGWPVLLVFAPLAWLAAGTVPGTWIWSLAAAFAAWVTWQLRAAFVRGHVGPTIDGLVAGIALLDAAVLARCGQTSWALFAIGAFVVTLIAQRARGPAQ